MNFYSLYVSSIGKKNAKDCGLNGSYKVALFLDHLHGMFRDGFDFLVVLSETDEVRRKLYQFHLPSDYTNDHLVYIQRYSRL